MFADLLTQGGLSLDRLQSFCLVAEAGGVTKAAQGDPVRQSLFSRQIKELEEFFGTELVRRKGRGVALTAAGERLHVMAREQLLALSDFKKTCAGQSVELAVAAGDSLIQWVLLPRLGLLRDKLPNVGFKVLNLPTAEIARRLRDATVDVALVRAGSVARPLKASSLGRMSFSLFVPAKLLPAPNQKTLTPQVIQQLPFATLEGAGQFRQELDRLSLRQNLEFNLQLELSSFPLVAKAVQTGKFAAILPGIAARDLAQADIMEVRSDFLHPLSREIVLAWSPRLARVRATVDKAIPVFRALCWLE